MGQETLSNPPPVVQQNQFQRDVANHTLLTGVDAGLCAPRRVPRLAKEVEEDLLAGLLQLPVLAAVVLAIV